MAELRGNPINFLRQWPNDATLTLIHLRREYQQLFTTTGREEQRGLWREIANEVNHQHQNYNVITTKLNMLKLILKPTYI